MNKLLCVFVILGILSCMPPAKKLENEHLEIDQKYFRHLRFLIQLKNDVAGKEWPSFSERDFYQPVVYYTSNGTYVIHPNEHIRKVSDFQHVGSFDQEELLKLSTRYTDTTNFQFSNSYSDSDSTALYYHENVLSFQSFELTQKFIPDITDLQDWSIMVIHELFHGYQRSIESHRNYFVNLEIPDGPDQFLGTYHKDLNWFRESVHQENELLKAIWMENANLEQNLRAYQLLRDKRIKRIQREYQVDIREVEDYEIMLEGQARYFESLVKRYLSESKADTTMLLQEDLFAVGTMFDGYKVTTNKGLYDIYNDRYYYSLGFNISMILEKGLPDYKKTIYKEEQSFNKYLDLMISENKE